MFEGFLSFVTWNTLQVCVLSLAEACGMTCIIRAHDADPRRRVPERACLTQIERTTDMRVLGLGRHWTGGEAGGGTKGGDRRGAEGGPRREGRAGTR